MFWFDVWTDLGPLIEYIGDGDPRQLRIPRGAKVAYAVSDMGWSLPAARSQRVLDLHIKLSSLRLPIAAHGPDRFEWMRDPNISVGIFSSANTWKLLRQPSPEVPWHPLSWFSEGVPRYGFIQWLALRGRLPTRDKLYRWGAVASSTCLLCSLEEESHSHLFFRCNYSTHVWHRFARYIWNLAPLDLHATEAWIRNPGNDQSRNRCLIALILLQCSVYLLWSERNTRIFRGVTSTIDSLCGKLNAMVRNCILSLLGSSRRIDPALLADWYTIVLSR
ncbi:PREDICTED: uncharacterized protein LOC104801610 [Tarenaya hassleriana]|uniref:uncharacterized protein LOC104801610 n=1 Tax=Tarenaya hassleriana TaxID=28532 RepID=UPI00053C7E96|nr:PREDICTED: uncharacterized protein LOC104801610 [Tarenaya hassleriana]